MHFFVIIGKESLYVYEKVGNKFEKQFIEGSYCYPYDINNGDEEIDTFMDALANEKNLGTKAKLQFDILESEDQIHTNYVLKSMDQYICEKYELADTIFMLLKKLLKDKTLKIEKYGINYDGNCYRINNQQLVKGPFNLLAYTICEDDIMGLI